MKKIALILMIFACMPLSARERSVRNVASLRKALESAEAGDTIILKKGVYRIRESLKLEGKTDVFITGQDARISGGIRIRKCRLHRAPGLGKGVKRLSLKHLPVSGVCTKGDPRLSGTSWSEFFADGKAMRLSEWPDGEPLPLDSVVSPGRGFYQFRDNEGLGVIAFREDRPLEWKNPTLGWLYGCFRYGWTCEQVPIAAMGPGKTFTAGDMTNYGFGFKPGECFQRWKVLNIPEEVTQPGEFSLDVEGKVATLMLPEGTRRPSMGFSRQEYWSGMPSPSPSL